MNINLSILYMSFYDFSVPWLLPLRIISRQFAPILKTGIAIKQALYGVTVQSEFLPAHGYKKPM